MKKIILLAGIVLISMSFLLSQIPTYHQFYGSVKNSDGTSVSHVLQIKAYINGVLTETANTENGIYGYTSLFFVKNGNNGDSVDFYLNGILSSSFIFENEKTTYLNLTWPCGNGVVEDDLGEDCDTDAIPSTCQAEGYDSGTLSCTFDCRFDTADCHDENNGNGGDSGNGGSNVLVPLCSEKWNCLEWRECLNSVQKRDCIDLNKCRTAKNKPQVSRNCVENLQSEEEFPDSDLEPLQKVETSKISMYSFWIVLLILVFILFIFFMRRKLGKKSKKIEKRMKKDSKGKK